MGKVTVKSFIRGLISSLKRFLLVELRRLRPGADVSDYIGVLGHRIGSVLSYFDIKTA